MSTLHIEPAYQSLCREQGLESVRAFMQLDGVIWGGHPHRQVLQGKLGTTTIFLKKEFTVPWRSRLLNALAGFGPVALARREALFLGLLRKAGVGCPEVIACGEEQGQAFLLVRAAAGVELRTFLEQAAPPQRRQLARKLGEALAHMHAAGFAHPDLLAKHILVADDGRFVFLDWQRSPLPHPLSRRERMQNLAVLDATLAAHLAAGRDRLELLRSYGRFSSLRSLTLPARPIASLSGRLQRRRRIQELRQTALPSGQQNLIWLDGERLCITRQFRDEYHERAPLAFWTDVGPEQPRRESVLVLDGQHTVRLVRTWTRAPWRWLWLKCRRRSLPAPAFAQAAALFRLERQGVALPRLLAVGQDFATPWTSTSFLLTEPHAGTVPLASFLSQPNAIRVDMLTQAGATLRRIHDAGYRLDNFDDWAVAESEFVGQAFQPDSSDPSKAGCLRRPGKADLQRIVLQSVEHLRKSTSPRRRDVLAFCREHGLSRRDMVGFYKGYGKPLRDWKARWLQVGRALRRWVQGLPRRAPA